MLASPRRIRTGVGSSAFFIPLLFLCQIALVNSRTFLPHLIHKMKIVVLCLSKTCPHSVLGFITVDIFPVLSGKMLKATSWVKKGQSARTLFCLGL